jgi:DUF1365 family protein
MNSALYRGWVRHERYSPPQHDFTYQLFMLYLDLDELETVFAKRWFWSIDRFNLANFKRRDHLGDPSISLKQAVIDLVKSETGHEITGPIRLLTHLRYWGYCFNPISIYYGFDAEDKNIEFIVAEVNNTPWGERHCYIFTPTQNIGTTQYQHYRSSKQMHVSPLLPMDFIYDWRFGTPIEKLAVQIKLLKQEKLCFNAILDLQRHEITSKNLATTLIKHPFMTSKVILMIYWQALRTWLKGARFYSHPSNEGK